MGGGDKEAPLPLIFYWRGEGTKKLPLPFRERAGVRVKKAGRGVLDIGALRG